MAAQAIRTDIQPVIIGGDISSYALAREFHEAYGLTSICVVPAPLKIIELSRIIRVHRVEDMRPDDVRDALRAIAGECPEKHVVVMANSDYAVDVIEQIANDLPANVICPVPPHDVVKRASSKVAFAQMCEAYGLDAPHSEIVSLAGDDPIPPSNIPFPLIAKPSVSADYSHLYFKGFKKIYFIHEQAELDELWRDLRAAGFTGEFLVQELIPGDDTNVDMITIYINRAGKPTMFVSSRVVLEDHAPTLFGNPVGMVTQPMPELWERVAHMLADIGWRGFANFDTKRDPRDGREVFMDFNPRIGANSYYACAGGVNPMQVLIEDHIDGIDTVHAIDRVALYARAPVKLLRRYIIDEELLQAFDAAVARGDVYNSLRYPADTLSARLMGWIMEKNYIRKFKKYYPERTDSAF